MTDDPRVQELLDALHDSDATPEEVCGSCPELLPVVRDRWRQVRRLRADLDAMFPSSVPAPQQPPNWTVLPHIPGHEVEAFLGRGGAGIVFRARHLRLNRPVAVKMLLAGAYAEPHERGRFQREAEAIASLRHPNVVQVYDVGEVDGRPYFTMEFVEGGSLAQKLAGTPLPAREAAELLATLAAAVHAAHTAGIVHRDLKPGNVLLTADGTPKVGDFGLARRLGGDAGLTRTGIALGTPSYMAPEQVQGKHDAEGPATDVYALGAILYESLTGRPPYKGETGEETLRQVASQEPVHPSRLNPKVPRDLETICLHCLHKEPARRYTSAAALAEDLGRFQDGRPVRARRLGPAARSWRWCRRNPVATALVSTSIALIALAIGGGFWLERQRSERREDAARQEGQKSQALNGAIEKAATLQLQGRWAEARAVFEDLQDFLGDSAPDDLRERLRLAQMDVDMVAELERIRLGKAGSPSNEDPANREIARLYAGAFHNYGIPIQTLAPEDAKARFEASSIRETLLAYLHDWLGRAADEDRVRLRDVLDFIDNDDWRTSFRKALVKKDFHTLKQLATAPETSDESPAILSVLGDTVFRTEHTHILLPLLQNAHQRFPGDFWINYQLGLYWIKERPREAVGYFRAAIAVRPTSDQAFARLAEALRKCDDIEGSIAAMQKSFDLNPNYDSAKDLIATQVQRGRLEEARAVWQKVLEGKPKEHEPWYGYAELCLFLGKDDEYRRARRELLDRFHSTTNPFDAERTGRACLLLPVTGDELSQAVALAQRAVAVKEGDKWGHPYFQFVQGLAEYRQGQFDRTITTMQGDASSVLGPAPRLVLAIALHRSGQEIVAREVLAKAIQAHDWRSVQFQVIDPSGWIYQILRREAENLIVPNLHAFLDGKYQPKDNDERLAFTGACQFANRTRTIARLYADVFAVAPALADDLDAGYRYNAARAAALAGCGRGADVSGLGDEEKAQLREQARQWLRAELAARARVMSAGPAEARGAHRLVLTRWRSESDLVGLRDPSELSKLAPEERSQLLALWADLTATLARTDK